MKQRLTSDVAGTDKRDGEPLDDGEERPGSDADEAPSTAVEEQSPDRQPTRSDSEDEVTEDSDAEENAEENADSNRGGVRAFIRRVRLPRTRKARTIAAVVLLLLAGGGAGGYFWWANGQLPDDAAFRVDDHVVTVDELSQVTDTWRALYGIEPPQETGELDRFRRDAAKAYAVSLILDKAAQDRGIVVADKTARDTLSRFVTQQFGEGQQARDQFIQTLGNAGTSERAVLDEVKKQLAMSQLFDAVTKHTPEITERELHDAFDQRKDRLGTPERRELANIVVRTKEEADQIVSELRGGVSFDALARQRSLDGATRDSGGRLGALTRDQLQSGYANAAFTVAQGEYFGPVENEFGWNVGTVTKIISPVPVAFEQVREQLKQQLQLERSLRTWRDWLAGQIRDAGVEYADAYQPASPDEPPSVQPGEPGVGQQPTEPVQPRQEGPR